MPDNQGVSTNTPYAPVQAKKVARYLNVFNVAIRGQATITAMFERQTADIAASNTSIGRYCPAEEDMRAAIFASSVGLQTPGRNTVPVKVIFKIGNDPQREITMNVPVGMTIGELFQTYFSADVVRHPSMGNYIKSLFGTGERHGGWGWQFYVNGGLPYVLEETIMAPRMKNEYALSSMFGKNAKYLDSLNARLLERKGLVNPGFALPLPLQQGMEQAKKNHVGGGFARKNEEFVEAAIELAINATGKEAIVISEGQKNNPVSHNARNALTGPCQNGLPNSKPNMKSNPSIQGRIMEKKTMPGQEAKPGMENADTKIIDGRKSPAPIVSENGNCTDNKTSKIREPEFPEMEFVDAGPQVHFRPWEVGECIQIVKTNEKKETAILQAGRSSHGKKEFLKKQIIPFNKRKYAIILSQEKKVAMAGTGLPDRQETGIASGLERIASLILPIKNRAKAGATQAKKEKRADCRAKIIVPIGKGKSKSCKASKK